MDKIKKVTERIKTFDDAKRELGDNHPLVKEWRSIDNATPDLEAYLQLRVICAALNEGWEPQFTENEMAWFPSHCLWKEIELNGLSDDWKADHTLIKISDKYQSEYEGFAYLDSYYASCLTDGYSSRLYLKSKALAMYCGKQFIDLWAAFTLKPKTHE